MSRVVAIIQARMRASRLPGKVLLDLGGRPMLVQVIERVRAATRVDDVVVATSDAPDDDAVANLCAAESVPVFRGSEGDVLSRFHGAATEHRADVVVRITADCPFMDPAVIDRVVETYLTADVEYVANVLRYTYPDGLDVEVFAKSALDRAFEEAVDVVDREHVTPYLRNSGKFSVRGVENEEDLSSLNYRWTVDEPSDLEFARRVYGRLGADGRMFGMAEILTLLKTDPSLLEINMNTLRNEGYYTSVANGPPTPGARLNLTKSREWLERASKTVPSGSQTFSKGPNQFPKGVSPMFLERGQGSHVWDVDGNEFIDFINGLGPIILGYDHPAVTEAVVRQCREGATFSLPHRLEVEVAELLTEIIPCAEMTRFGKNGSDVTGGAIRVARAFTKREKVLCCGYHGWQDWFIGTTTRNLGVPRSTQDLTTAFPYNDLPALEQLLAANDGQVACVIMEPVGIVDPAPGFLEGVKALCEKHGALLVFDEVVTGFRMHLGGAQKLYGVTPDVACFGKAMGNGFPIAAIVGRRDVMKTFDDIFFSFTFGGDVVGLAAAKATIEVMKEGGVIEHLYAQGERLRDGYNMFAKHFGVDKVTQCIGLAPRTVCAFADAPNADALLVRSLVQQELIKRGVLFLVGHNLSLAHSNADVEHALRAHRSALEALAQALASPNPRSHLEGEPVQAVFRKA
jgi:glutamate-1-semialdehyde aminotransferase/spore coat polysaccharide biosynthesis protein SpsF (cytidylyltransferase family)